MAGGESYFYKNLTATGVVSLNMGAILHGVLLNSVAATATIQFYDANITTDTTTPIGGLWTPGAIVIPQMVGPLDIRTIKAGIMVVIGVAAANITVIFR